MPFENTLRAIVLGTSNGFFADGYVGAIKADPRISGVKNVSLGASPSTMIPYRLRDIDLADYDVIFVETVVNDAAAIRGGSYTESQLTAVLEWIVAKAKRANCLPVAIAIPGLNNDFTARTVELTRDAFCGHIFDMSAALNMLATRSGASIDTFMVDPAHVKRALARELCQAFLNELFKHKREDLLAVAPDRSEYDFSYFQLEENRGATDLGDKESAPAKTSFVDDSLFKLIDGQSIMATTGDMTMMAAVTVNQSATRCGLIIEGAETVMKDMRFDMIKDDVKMLVAALHTPLPCKADGSFTVRVHKPEWQKTYSARPDTLTISGFVVQSAIGSVGMVERVHARTARRWQDFPKRAVSAISSEAYA